MSEKEMAAVKGKILHFPTVMGAVVPVYNVPGITQELKFSPEVLAGIFLGTVAKWSDKRLAADNPGVKLPNEDVLVVHRTDGSGTTFVWTDYLSKISPEWKSKVGAAKAVSWPVGLGGAQNAGVTGLVKQTPNSIGYVELIFAVQNKMGYGQVKNSAGNFVKADIASVTEAAAGAKYELAGVDGSFKIRGHDSRIRQALKMFFEGTSHVLHEIGRSASVERTPDRFTVAVTGKPASPDFEITKIFKFYYTDALGNADLSLAAARLIAETYGGELNALEERDKVSIRLSFPGE